MVHTWYRKGVTAGIITLFIALITSGYAQVQPSQYDSASPIALMTCSSAQMDYIDVSVDDAWAMLNDPSPSNGIQTPVDVRTDTEWYGERINTPYPEEPKHFALSLLQSEEGMQEFKERYGGRDIIVYCKSGGRSTTAAFLLVENEFNGTIYNMIGGITAWKSAEYPTKYGNHPPSTPLQPSGPLSCSIGMPALFSTSTSDSDDDTIRYGWDWDGDSIIDQWTPYYPQNTLVELAHTWEVLDSFAIHVCAEDNVGEQSPFSDPLTITVTNTNPEAPTITGPDSGRIGKSYEYSFSTIDPDNHTVSYLVDWGDGKNTSWLGPYPSGKPISVEHTWVEKGSYSIRVKAKDKYEAESPWNTLEIQMPKQKTLKTTMLSELSLKTILLFMRLYLELLP